MDSDYKSAKESFTVNEEAASGALEIICVTCVSPAALFLLHVILSLCPPALLSRSVSLCPLSHVNRLIFSSLYFSLSLIITANNDCHLVCLFSVYVWFPT